MAGFPFLPNGAPQMQAGRPSLGNRIKTLLLDGTDGLEAQKRAQQQAQQEQLLSEYLERLGAPAEIRAAAKFNPGSGLEWLTKAAAPTKLSAGESIVSGGQTINAAPKYENVGDQTIRVGGMPTVEQDPAVRPVRTVDIMGQVEESDTSAPGGGDVQQVFKRDPTFDEQTDRSKVLADIDAQIEQLKLKRQQLDIDRGQLGVSQSRLVLDRQREGRVASKDGGGSSPALLAIEGALRKRGLLK